MKTKCICIPTSKFKQSLVKRERDRYRDYEDRDTILTLIQAASLACTYIRKWNHVLTDGTKPLDVVDL